MANYVTEIILLFLAVFLLIGGLPGVMALIRVGSWLRVPGQILSSSVAGYETQAGAGHVGASMQRAAVGYSYQTNGQSYVGQRAAFGTPLGFGMGLGGIASAQAARYTPGQQVEVWVDPANPMNSVLRRSAPSSVVLAALGVALLGVAAVSLIG